MCRSRQSGVPEVSKEKKKDDQGSRKQLDDTTPRPTTCASTEGPELVLKDQPKRFSGIVEEPKTKSFMVGTCSSVPTWSSARGSNGNSNNFVDQSLQALSVTVSVLGSSPAVVVMHFRGRSIGGRKRGRIEGGEGRSVGWIGGTSEDLDRYRFLRQGRSRCRWKACREGLSC